MLVTGKKSDSVVTKFSLKKAVNRRNLINKKLSEQIKLCVQNSQNAAKAGENTDKVAALSN